MWLTHFIVQQTGLSRWLSGKESACQCRRCKRCRFSPWLGKIPWRRKWQPTPLPLPGKSQGQRSLVGYSPWGCKRVRHDLATRTTTKQQTSYVKVNLPVILKKKGRKKKKITAYARYLSCESCSVVSDSLPPHVYTVHEVLQARILEWVAFPFSRGSSQPWDQTQLFCITGRFFTNSATMEAHLRENGEVIAKCRTEERSGDF